MAKRFETVDTVKIYFCAIYVLICHFIMTVSSEVIGKLEGDFAFYCGLFVCCGEPDDVIKIKRESY